MKPESQSRYVLKIAQSKAKMYEFNVPMDQHIRIQVDPANLFPLSIGLLGDLAASLNNGNVAHDEILELRRSLPFSARFFDTYIETRLNPNLDSYVRLLGAAAYYLCEMPGSSDVLAKRISNETLDVGGFGLENLLTWLLQPDALPSDLPNIPGSPYQEWITAIHEKYLHFVASGEQINTIHNTVNELRQFTYSAGTPRQLLLADLIGAIIRRKIENSTWLCLPRYTDIPAEEWANVIRKDTFIKEFWPAQHLLGDVSVFRGRSAVVQMPTSAGKTKAVEIIIRSAFLAERTSLVAIIAPFRALCHEIRQDLLRAFHKEAVLIDELSDVLQMDFSVERVLRTQQVLIATPEKFNYILRHEPELARNIGLIIYDEGHQFDNGKRGITYELLLTSLKSYLPESAQSVLISAVISNAEQIGQWLVGDEVETAIGRDLIPTFKSIGFASIRHPGRNLYFVNRDNLSQQEFYVPRIFERHSLRRNVRFPRHDDGKDIAIYLGLRLVRQGGVAIFSGTKASVGTMCETIAKIARNGLPLPWPIEVSNKIENQRLVTLYASNLGEDNIFTQCASLGIFSHHGSIPHGIRLAVEHAMQNGDSRFVICTSTLAQGVNLPIRYLIVTSIYHGREKIRVRDFQNLIGRAGRAGKHTEGSILFADPEIYDSRKYWGRVGILLDPTKSEECGSNLLNLVGPFYSDDRRYLFDIDLLDFVNAYTLGKATLQKWIERVAEQFAYYNVTFDRLSRQVEQKMHTLSAIESYLMANWDENQSDAQEEKVVSLAQGTLAYFLADDEQKQKIERLFVLLAENIEKQVPNVSRRIIFGKTMYGVPGSLAISAWFDEHIAQLSPEKTVMELFDILWDLIAANIHKKTFSRCNQPKAMRPLAKSWLQGASFYELFQELKQSGAKRMAGSRLWNYKIEDVVDICENGFGYEGILVLGALLELIQSSPVKESGVLADKIQQLQKRFKYGLPNQVAIILYELGFADRVVSIELSEFLLEHEITHQKDTVIQALQVHRDTVLSILNKYPYYFSQVYANVAT